MRSKTSFFNKTIFLKNIKRFWPVWTLYIIAFTIGMPVALASRAFRVNSSFSVSQYILNNALYMGTIMSFIFGIVSALAVFSYLYTARSVSAYHSLPIRREGLFITNFLSGFVWLFISNIFIFFVTLFTALFLGRLELASLFSWLIMLTLQDLIFFGFSTFCVTLTGNGFALIVIYSILNFAAVIIESLLRFCTSVFSYGISSGNTPTFGVLSPVYMLMGRTNIKYVGALPRIYFFNGWTTLIIYGAAGLIFALAAVLIYRRRHSESASEFIAVPVLRPVFKYFFAFLGSLVLGSLFYNIIFSYSAYRYGSPFPMAACMFIGGFLGYYITAMLLHKSFRVFKTTSIGFLVYSAALIALVAAFEYDAFGMERYIPSPESVASMSFYSNGVSGTVGDEDAIEKMTETHKSLIANKAVYETYVRGHRENYDYNASTPVNYTYTLKNGIVVRRSYMLFKEIESDNLIIDKLESALNSSEVMRDRMKEILDLSPESVVEISLNYSDESQSGKTAYIRQESIPEFLNDCLKADIIDGNLGRVSLNYNFKAETSLGYFEIMLYLKDNKTLAVSPNTTSYKTLAYLKKLGITPIFGENSKSFNSVVRTEKVNRG